MNTSNTIFIEILGRRFVIMIAFLCLLSSCQSTPPGPLAKGDQNNPWIVTIKFSGNSKCTIDSVTAESNACGIADPADICVENSKFLEWQSDPAGVGFNVYFDPLKNGPNYVAANGKRKVQIDQNVPPGMYKYAILGRDNSCDPATDTLDPRIRVDN